MLDFLVEVRQSMARRKLTYALAVLSLGVGVAAYLCIVGLWDAMFRDQMARARDHPQTMSPSLRVDLPGQQQPDSPRRELDVAQVAALAEQTAAGPTAFLEAYQTDVKLRRWAVNAQVTAVSEGWLTPEFHSSPVVLEGRAFDVAEYREGRAVCLVSEAVANVLARFGQPIGQTIRLAGNGFTVVGVEAMHHGDEYMAVTIPFSAGRTHLVGQRQNHAAVVSFTRADRLAADMDRVEAALNRLTGESHHWRDAGSAGGGKARVNRVPSAWALNG